MLATGRTRGVVNTHEIITGEFTRNTEFTIPGERLLLSLERKMRDGLQSFDASELAAKVMGDAIYSNMILMGASWQMGQVPIAGEAIRRAIELNGAKVEENLRAFEIGRWAVLNPGQVEKVTASSVVELPKTLEEKIAFRERHLVAYQGPRLAKRYRKFVERFEDPALKEAVAKGYHKLLAYKDEYEVARLLQETRAKAEEAFDGDLKLTYHLAPPLLSKDGPNGRPVKRPFKESREWQFRLLARLKRLRGTPFDPFGYTAERRMERRLIKQYEKDMGEVLKAPDRHVEAAKALAELPLQIRGFGPVKHANAEAAAKRREELLAAFRAGDAMPEAAE